MQPTLIPSLVLSRDQTQDNQPWALVFKQENASYYVIVYIYTVNTISNVMEEIRKRQ